MMITWRRFVESDWYGLAGCERFSDGSEPFIGEIEVDGYEGFAVFDSRGVYIDWTTEGDADCEDGVDHQYVAPISTVVLLTAKTTKKALKALGFKSG